MHVYAIGPIDFGWEHLATVEDFAAKLAAIDARVRVNGWSGEFINSEMFIGLWEQAKEQAKAAGWEGDFREPPAVFFIPENSTFMFGFVIKQDNNGTTFVVSPRRLPHLE